MPYIIPPYATLRLDVAFARPNRPPYIMELEVTEIGDGGIEDILAKVVAAAEARGFTPMTEELFAEIVAKARDEKLDAMLTVYKGMPGGDA